MTPPIDGDTPILPDLARPGKPRFPGKARPVRENLYSVYTLFYIRIHSTLALSCDMLGLKYGLFRVAPHLTRPVLLPEHGLRLEKSWGMNREKLKFLPLFLFYLAFILIASDAGFQKDEDRYALYAANLAQGYYSPPGEVDLWAGPGYPLVLLPFVLLELPWLAAKLLNALFLFGAVLYFYSTLRLYVRPRPALASALLLGFYLPFFKDLHLLMTETLAVFLVCGFACHFSRLAQGHDGFHLGLASFYLGYLALTKIIFGYVLVAGLGLFLVLGLWRWRERWLLKAAAVYGLALVVCLPYLLYTYSLTHQVFYWGNSGGMSLYWMSTPYDGELGDWFSFKQVRENPALARNHQHFFSRIEELPGVSRDDAFKRQAVANITRRPMKFAENWAANVGRLVFDYPYSFKEQKLSTYYYIVPNMFLVVLGLLSLYPAAVHYRRIPLEIYGLLAFNLVTFVGASLLSAYNRQFVPLAPIFFLWITYVLVHLVEVRVRPQL